MKKFIYIVSFIFLKVICMAQEPGFTGFSFKLYNSNNKLITPKHLKRGKIQIFFIPKHVSHGSCCWNDSIKMKFSDSLTFPKQESFPRYPEQENHLPLGFSDSLQCFTFSMFQAPAASCAPSFIIVQNKDTMFVQMPDILNCIRKSVRNLHCDPFIMTLKKGYYSDQKPVEGIELSYQKKYFRHQLLNHFSYWAKVK